MGVHICKNSCTVRLRFMYFLSVIPEFLKSYKEKWSGMKELKENGSP